MSNSTFWPFLSLVCALLSLGFYIDNRAKMDEFRRKCWAEGSTPRQVADMSPAERRRIGALPADSFVGTLYCQPQKEQTK